MSPPVAYVQAYSYSQIENSAVVKQSRKTYRQLAAEIKELRAQLSEMETRNDDLEAFARMVAHDLKNPVAMIVGSSWALRDLVRWLPETLQPEGMQWIDQITDAARKSNEIIDELLLLAMARRSEIEFGPVDMGRIVREALRQLAPLTAEYSPELVLPAAWPASQGYAPWLEAVWTNYISNAIRYGGTPPRVELGAAAQMDGFVRYWVSDNGAGLQGDEIAKLFLPFSQLRSARPQGHGLGLSIARRIVERLGGQVGVESTPGQGSTFFFTLPEVAAPE